MTDSETTERLAQRYPAPSRWQRWSTVVVLVVVVAVAAVWFLGTSSRIASPPVQVQIISFDVVDDQHIEVTMLVDRSDPAKAATCTLYAAAPAGDDQAVGEAEVTIPPASERSVEFTTELRTYKRAGNAHVRDCSV